MMLIGLAGSAGVGKDTAADYLVEQYGFTKFSFSDALYREVSEAFNIPISELRDRDRKEKPHDALRASNCVDTNFAWIMDRAVRSNNLNETRFTEFSPRWVLQHWGTEYRRWQDQNYWLKKADLWMEAWLYVTKETGISNPGLVNTSVRFHNEQEWINKHGGVTWHVRRNGTDAVSSELEYVSEQLLPMLPGDRNLLNFGTVEQLRTATSLLLQASDNDPYHDSMIEKGKLVACAECGKVHIGFSREEVARQVRTFNTWLDEQKPTPNLPCGGEHVMVDDYSGCTQCESNNFIKLVLADNDDADGVLTAPPVIYEESN